MCGDAMSAASIQPESTEDVSAVIDYCGEIYEVRADQEFLIGREADLCIDDNPYLHRRLVRISCHDGLWWLDNIGSRIAVTVADASGSMQARVGPGARIPLVFESAVVVFAAGPTTYEFSITVRGDDIPQLLRPHRRHRRGHGRGSTFHAVAVPADPGAVRTLADASRFRRDRYPAQCRGCCAAGVADHPLQPKARQRRRQARSDGRARHAGQAGVLGDTQARQAGRIRGRGAAGVQQRPVSARR